MVELLIIIYLPLNILFLFSKNKNRPLLISDCFIYGFHLVGYLLKKRLFFLKNISKKTSSVEGAM